MGKITIKHYVNNELKAVGKLYPLYVQVIYKRKVYKFKSNDVAFEYVNEDTLKFLNDNNFLNSEKKDIERTILDLETLKMEVSSKNISKFSKSYFNYLEDNFKKLIEKEFKKPPYFFINNSYSEIINVVNYIDGFGFYEYSQNISTLINISENLGARSIKREDFLCIDFFGGSKFEELIEYFEAYCCKERESETIKEYLEIFKNFINL